jgi:Adenylate and Guanylate cyclase catalytic domain
VRLQPLSKNAQAQAARAHRLEIYRDHLATIPEASIRREGFSVAILCDGIMRRCDLFGATVILASRIAAKAGAGEILVPDTVRGLVSGKGFMFTGRGEFVPKGFDEGVRLWSVRWRD